MPQGSYFQNGTENPPVRDEFRFCTVRPPGQQGRMAGLMQMHPYHVRLATTIVQHRLGDLFGVIDALDPKLRDETMMMTFMHVVGIAQTPGPYPPDAVLGDLIANCVNYPAFKETCYKLAEAGVSQQFLVQSILLDTLAYAYQSGNVENIPDMTALHQSVVDELTPQIQAEAEPEKRAHLEHLMAPAKEMLGQLSQRIYDNRDRYDRFCETVVKALVEKPVPAPRLGLG